MRFDPGVQGLSTRWISQLKTIGASGRSVHGIEHHEYIQRRIVPKPAR
jgi:hypothetical protein